MRNQFIASPYTRNQATLLLYYRDLSVCRSETTFSPGHHPPSLNNEASPQRSYQSLFYPNFGGLSRVLSSLRDFPQLSVEFPPICDFQRFLSRIPFLCGIYKLWIHLLISSFLQSTNVQGAHPRSFARCQVVNKTVTPVFLMFTDQGRGDRHSTKRHGNIRTVNENIKNQMC